MSALAVAPAPTPGQPAPRGRSVPRDLFILFDREGRIRWMNSGARDTLSQRPTVLDVLQFSGPLPALRCFPLGNQWLWLGLIPDQQGWRLNERARRANEQLWEVSRRYGDRNLHLARAEGRLETQRRRAARERLSQRAASEMIGAVEAERGRIARELHDNAGQSLAGILLNLELVERQLAAADTEVVARLKRSRELSSLTLDQIRRISHELHPPEWREQEFGQVVEWLVESMGLRSRLEVDVVTDVPRGAPQAVLTVLYRTLQEALANILRHAEARRVAIEASAGSRGIRLIVEDDGKGFDLETAPSGGGIGLINMRRRVESLGGHLEVSSTPGKGTRLSVLVPITPETRNS